jgi:hypothetical protein
MIKRLLLSLAGGIIIPILYIFVIGMVIGVVKNISGSVSGDSLWLWFLSLPLQWSGHIYNYLFPPKFEKVFGELRGEVIWTNIITSFIVYSLLTYLVLWWRARQRRLP